MLTSPQSGPEWESAIKETLVFGEELINFDNCWVMTHAQTSWLFTPKRWDLYQWRYLAITNINVRCGVWKWEYRGNKVTQVHSECEEISCIAIDDIELFQVLEVNWPQFYQNFHPSSPNINLARTLLLLDEKRTGMNRQNAKDKGSGYLVTTLPVYVLNINLKSGDENQFFSIFENMKTVGKNYQEVKSGGLLAAKASSAANALEKLVPLLEEGIISQEEFDRAKGGFLGSSTEVQETSINQLRQLYSLRNDGVLTEGEFNMKKWDILSKN